MVVNGSSRFLGREFGAGRGRRRFPGKVQLIALTRATPSRERQRSAEQRKNRDSIYEANMVQEQPYEST